MISIDKMGGSNIERSAIIYCKSTDTKPVNDGVIYIPNGSACIELDTGVGYFFDEEANEWVEIGQEKIMNGLLAYLLSCAYTKKTLIGMSALKGSPAKVTGYDINESTGDTTVHYQWTDENFDTHTGDVITKRGAKGD